MECACPKRSHNVRMEGGFDRQSMTSDDVIAMPPGSVRFGRTGLETVANNVSLRLRRHSSGAPHRRHTKRRNDDSFERVASRRANGSNRLQTSSSRRARNWPDDAPPSRSERIYTTTKTTMQRSM
uniref:Uncharacterized protein n=1 Tax=Plectus sambesii TaxID=2011161 RepID=A0A914VC40_9BILA